MGLKFPGGGGNPLYWVTGYAAQKGGVYARVFLELGIH